MRTEADVLIVGAGLAGLSAAHRLQADGIDVVVLEASDRIGGRTRSETLGGSAVDFGAEWLGPRHTHLQALIRELGCSTEPARMIGRPILWRGADKRRVGRSLAVRDEITAARVWWRLRRLAQPVDPQRPWDGPESTRLDRVSFGEWLRDNGVRGDLYSYLAGLVSMLTGTPADRLSLLQVVWWCSRGGGPVAMLRTTFASRITGGTQSVAAALVDALDGRVETNRTVTRIEQSVDGATVHTADSHVYRSRRVIVTGALDAKTPIAFAPALPTDLAGLDELRIPPSTKVTAILPEGCRPRHVLALGGSPLGAAWRNGTRITGFVLPGHENATDDDLITDLAACYETEPQQLRNPQIYRWSTHLAIGGCDIGFHPGQLTRHGPQLATGHGRIDFAGAERSSWPNNMEGAVESGIRAATEAAAALKPA